MKSLNNYIFIEDLSLMVNIGISEKEKKNKQKLLISIQLWTDLGIAANSDKIEDTINYEEVTNKIIELTNNKTWNLIETFAKDIDEIIKENFAKISKIEIKIKKFILKNTKSTGIVFSS